MSTWTNDELRKIAEADDLHISPFREDRRKARQVLGDRFVEVFVDAPLEVCEERDPRGLYRKARAGEIPDFTGISSPYETPAQPELHLPTHELSPIEAVDRVVAFLEKQGYIG